MSNSKEYKEKMSKIAKKKGFGKWMLGKKLSKETRKKLSEMRKGKLHPMYGKKHSLEARKKISLAGRGRKVSLETRIKQSVGIKKNLPRTAFKIGFKHTLASRLKISKAFSGSNHPNWKGGITELDKVERNKFKRTIQKLVFERDNYTCQICGEKRDLQVDHIQPWAEYIELRFDINNCRTLCQACHYFITYKRPKPKNIKWGYYPKEVYHGLRP